MCNMVYIQWINIRIYIQYGLYSNIHIQYGLYSMYIHSTPYTTWFYTQCICFRLRMHIVHIQGIDIFDSICISCRFNIHMFCLYMQYRLYSMDIYSTLYATSSMFKVYIFDTVCIFNGHMFDSICISFIFKVYICSTLYAYRVDLI